MRLRLTAPVCAAFSLITVMIGGVSPVSAQVKFNYQTPSEYYLSLRRTYPPRPGLTPDVLAQNPDAYSGATLELDGRLSGIVRTEDGGAFLMLSTDKHGSITLKMSLIPSWIQPGSRLRVLVVAVGGDEETVQIGVPDMQVVAVASSWDIAAAEERWRREATARAERTQKREAALKQARQQLLQAQTQPTRGSNSSRSASRGISSRALSSANVLSALSGDALKTLPYYQAFIERWNHRLSSGESQIIAASVLLFSEEYDVDPRLMMALLIAESDFRPQTTSHKGAMGLGQLMPDEVKDLGLSNPYDPVQNIYGSVYLLKGRLNKYSGNAASENLEMKHIILALASYNAGMGAVKKYGGVPPYKETQNYVRKIEAIYRQLCGEGQKQ